MLVFCHYIFLQPIGFKNTTVFGGAESSKSSYIESIFMGWNVACLKCGRP